MEELELKLQEILSKNNIELVDVEFVRDGSYNYLRVYIETDNLDDCERTSKLIDSTCDEYIKEKYFLEVSTPGIERKLKKEKDFNKFKGYKVLIKTKSNIDDKKSFIGILNGIKDGNDIVDNTAIPLSKIKTAKTVYEFNNLKEVEE